MIEFLLFYFGDGDGDGFPPRCCTVELCMSGLQLIH